jgi:hypothetical protein
LNFHFPEPVCHSIVKLQQEINDASQIPCFVDSSRRIIDFPPLSECSEGKRPIYRAWGESGNKESEAQKSVDLILNSFLIP